MTSNVPSVTFGPTGFIAPTEPAILAGVLADFNAAFGGNMNTSLATPQGQLATSLAALIGDADQTFAYYTNQVDPAYAQGRMQDAIGRIYFMTRNPAEPTVVSCLCVGLQDTVIPVGALATDTGGNIYFAVDGGTIPAGGSITLSFANTVPGPTPCQANTLTQIYQAIPGWDSINNPSDGVLGQNTESRAAFEERRIESVAANSRGMVQSVQGRVLAVSGVLDSFSYQNSTNNPLTYRGVTLVPNSIYVAVVGGTDDDVANAIWTKKSPGCSYNGNTNVTVYDTNSGYSDPLPSYVVSFERPEEVPILFSVILANSSQVPANVDTLVQNAIINAFAGQDGGARARIGSTLYASRFYAPVAALGAWAQIIEIKVGSTNTPDASFTAQIAAMVMTVSAVASGHLLVGGIVSGAGVTEGTEILNQLTGVNAASCTAGISGTTMTVSAVGAGALAAGQVLHGTGVTPGTTIVQQLTGSAGSTGTYRVSLSQTVGGGTNILADTPGTTGTYTVSATQTIGIDTSMKSATANLDFVSVDIDQVPVTAAADIQTTLQ